MCNILYIRSRPFFGILYPCPLKKLLIVTSCLYHLIQYIKWYCVSLSIDERILIWFGLINFFWLDVCWQK